MIRRFFARLFALGLAAAVVAGCSDLGAGATEEVDVTMQKTDAAVAQVVGAWYASSAGNEAAAAAISPDTVAALPVRVTRIEFLPADGEEADDGAWIQLTLSQSVVIDLIALPTEGQSPLVIASGTVRVGNYKNVRLFTDSASITFKGDVSLGQAITFEGGRPYPVDIPSGAQTGIKTDATFTVEADAAGNVNDVNLLFSAGSTMQNVTATGAGTVILAPVIRGRP